MRNKSHKFFHSNGLKEWINCFTLKLSSLAMGFAMESFDLVPFVVVKKVRVGRMVKGLGEGNFMEIALKWRELNQEH